MRREGFEMMVGAPTVIFKEIDGARCEPWEMIECTVPDEYTGSVVDMMARRKGELVDMAANPTDSMTAIKYLLPTRGVLGLRNALLTATRGTVIIDSNFDSYKPFAGELETREKGSLLAYESGTVTPFGIMGAQDRGQMFIPPRIEIYSNMIIGIHQRPGDLKVNVCKAKALTNMRSSGADEKSTCVPHIEMSLDACVEYINVRNQRANAHRKPSKCTHLPRPLFSLPFARGLACACTAHAPRERMLANKSSTLALHLFSLSLSLAFWSLSFTSSLACSFPRRPRRSWKLRPRVFGWAKSRAGTPRGTRGPNNATPARAARTRQREAAQAG
mmetsp:Transcript_70945/g.198954  ORF Transcript_70945/g.198954 Transcript_70945/m.198954 type:complete len:331 (-) Transcript_70945:128-1120(-)